MLGSKTMTFGPKSGGLAGGGLAAAGPIPTTSETKATMAATSDARSIPRSGDMTAPPASVEVARTAETAAPVGSRAHDPRSEDQAPLASASPAELTRLR